MEKKKFIEMTKEEKYAVVAKECNAINDCILDDELKEASQKLETIAEHISAYNKQLREIEYDKMLAGVTLENKHDAVLNCLKASEIAQIRLKHIMPTDNEPEKYEITDINRLVDILEFNKYGKAKLVTNSMFANPQWQHHIEGFTQMLCNRIAHDIEAEKASVKYSKKAAKKATDFTGKFKKNPVSNTTLKKAAQELMDGIYTTATGEEEANAYIFTSADLNAMLYGITKVNNAKRASFSIPRTKTVLSMLIESYCRIIAERSWIIE